MDYVTRQFTQGGECMCCIPSAILLHELLTLNGYASTLTKGVLVVNYHGAKKACFHVWVDMGGRQLDVAHDISCQQVPQMGRYPKSLHTSTELPNGCRRIDLGGRDEVAALVECVRMIDDYMNAGATPKTYWSSSPPFLQGIRRRAFIAMAPPNPCPTLVPPCS
ncbi:MAG: hypothetical protein WDW38_006400 [Sanguina aurantia]